MNPWRAVRMNVSTSNGNGLAAYYRASSTKQNWLIGILVTIGLTIGGGFLTSRILLEDVLIRQDEIIKRNIEHDRGLEAINQRLLNNERALEQRMQDLSQRMHGIEIQIRTTHPQ